MGEGYAAIQRGGGGRLPIVGGGSSLMTHSAGYVITQRKAFKYVYLIFKTGHGKFAIHKDLLF
jgi:hypothetical protein